MLQVAAPWHPSTLPRLGCTELVRPQAEGSTLFYSALIVLEEVSRASGDIGRAPRHPKVTGTWRLSLPAPPKKGTSHCEQPPGRG